MASYNRKYKKSSFCKYCGKQSSGKPFCSSCLKKYFNYDKNKKISNFIIKQRSSYPMQWFEINDYNMNKDNSNLYTEPWLSDRQINKYKNNPNSKAINMLTETTSERANRIDRLLNGYK